MEWRDDVCDGEKSCGNDPSAYLAAIIISDKCSNFIPIIISDKFSNFIPVIISDKFSNFVSIIISDKFSNFIPIIISLKSSDYASANFASSCWDNPSSNSWTNTRTLQPTYFFTYCTADECGHFTSYEHSNISPVIFAYSATDSRSYSCSYKVPDSKADGSANAPANRSCFQNPRLRKRGP